MKLTKKGKVDKRVKHHTIIQTVDYGVNPSISIDPNELLEKLLTENHLRLDFDALEGTVVTKSGIIKLDKPVLAVKAYYV